MVVQVVSGLFELTNCTEFRIFDSEIFVYIKECKIGFIFFYWLESSYPYLSI